jgi:hypothetical protein
MPLPILLCLYAIFMHVRIVSGNPLTIRVREALCENAKWAVFGMAALAIAATHAASPPVRTCQRVEIQGEVNTGEEWKAAVGQGWVLRLLPIGPPSAGYSGWDIAIDRDRPAGYPDSLLVATLPYDSINEREIGTTFGLRAQDAIGWNPRSFRFLTEPEQFRQAQQWFRQLAGERAQSGASKTQSSEVAQRLLKLASNASSGQLRILDARLVPGIADAPPFAQSWALAFSRTPHQIVAATGNAKPRGELRWMRFTVTLWLPRGWQFPFGTKWVRSDCRE